MTTARDRLEQAHADRRARVDEALDRQIEEMLEVAGLSEAKAEGFTIDPAEAKQLKGIIARLRRMPHPFTTCMRDLKKHKPEWTDDRRKRTCQSLKQAAGRATNASLSRSDEPGVCIGITDGMAAMLERLDEEVLAIMAHADESLAVISSKQRKQLPPGVFVFPKDKRYPIHDIAHARNALARSSGKPEEAAVKAAVYRRYPELKSGSKKKAAA